MQPLPKYARDLFSKHQSEYKSSGNKGLMFDRFYDGYNQDYSVDNTANTTQLSNLVGPCGNKDQLANACGRRIQLVSQLQGQFGVFKTDWQFVTGMGNSNPTENGFSWHPVLGTPYLPGSSVKGLLRAWMESWAFDQNQQQERDALVLEWFGGNKRADNHDGKAGDLIFFDAIPVDCPSVGVDTITPHMGDWYKQGGGRITADSTPGDWHTPKPVSFLVTKEARFLFSIAPRVPGEYDLAKQAMERLKDALAWLGAGGKTATGYGHMSYDENDSLQCFERQRLANMSEAQRVMDMIDRQLASDEKSNRPEPGGSCKGALHAAIEQAEAWPKADRDALKALTEKVLAFHDGIKWKKKDKAKALYQRILELC